MDRHWLGVVLMLWMMSQVRGHGRLMVPYSRSSMWRFLPGSNPINYQDNELNCGGYFNQWEQNGGKCGICGDQWEGPRENEAGGKYANDVIAADFQQGAVIDITMEITANHEGWHEFRLCPQHDPAKPATQECLDKHVLELADGSGTRWKQLPGNTNFTVSARLPPDVACHQCVLQWKWNTGNRWNTDSDTGESCVGCGPQEQFYGCADIAIANV